MKTIKLGTLDKPVSRMGRGTWAIGGGSAWGGDKDLQESMQRFAKLLNSE